MDKNIQLKTVQAKKEAIFAFINSLYDLSKKITLSETRSQEDFLAQTSNLDRLYDQFSALNDECNTLSIQIDATFVPSYQAWLSFENIFSRVQHTRLKVLESRNSQTTDDSTSVDKKPHFSIKLPPIEIPYFDGKPENWPLFYNSFKINVHENLALCNAQRVQYLVGKLSGQALAIFAGTIPNEANYSSIWDSLVKKYQDKRALGTFYLNLIFDSKNVANNASSLNSFVERFASSKAALEQLGIADLVDFIFMHLALKKVDAQLVQSFEMSVRNKDIPSCSEFIEYLRYHVKVMERTNVGPSNTRTSVQSSMKTPSGFASNPRSRNITASQSHSFAITSNNETKSCSLCNQSDHSRMYECSKFKNLSVKSRFEYIKTNKYCTNCLSSKHTHSLCNSQSRCKHCGQKHHSLIHFDKFVNCPQQTTPPLRAATDSPRPANAAMPVQAESSIANSITATTVTTNPSKQKNNITNTTILLGTAQVYAYAQNHAPTVIRCLVDSASQNNLISLQCCKKLNLQITPLHNSVIKTVGSNSTPTIGYTSLTIKSRISDDKYNINLIVVARLTEKLPIEYIDGSVLDYLVDLPMADESWNVPGEIDALLGAQLFPYLLLGGRVKSPSPSLPAPPAIETTLGYVIMGEIPIYKPVDVSWSFGPLISSDALNESLNKFWKLEELPAPCTLSGDDTECEKLYTSSVHRDNSGRYIVSLPFKHSPSMLGNSHIIAKRRLSSLERKFKVNSELRQAYNSVIRDYLDKGYLSEIQSDDSSLHDGYFIPHHAVVRPDKSTTKCRIVLDASAKTDTGYSLNDLLHTGPNLQADLFTLLLNFRLFAIAISADVQQMYLRILLTEEHRKYQKILFRFNESEPHRVFQFNSVAFGLRSSPFLAMRTIKQLASDEYEHFPLASKTASHELYMDDLTSSLMTVQEGITLSNQLLHLFKAGGFALLKWSCNSPELLASLPESHRAAVEFSDGSSLKILGMKWLPVSDNFSFTASATSECCTKRIILSTIARLFDVLGLVAPVILFAKLLMQELWLANIGWDDIPPQSIVDRFTQFKAELPLLSNLIIPRHLGVIEDCIVNIVAYGDASMKAYGCAVYLHITEPSGKIRFNLICAKSKVAPVKTISLARLELCAALLLSQLVRVIFDTFNDRYKINQIYAFSDSTIALSWIHSSPHRWQVFVANRVTKIHENLPAKHFFHINGIENPSDCLSRGLLPSQLQNHPLWWHGPPWALSPISEWPVEPFQSSRYEGDIPEEKNAITLVATVENQQLPIYELALRISSWNKLLRIVTYILKFLKRIPRSAPINPSDLQMAELLVLRNLQMVHFKSEIKLIKTKGLSSAPHRKLKLFIDNQGILRVGGRLYNANLPFENRHPILLPRRDHIVNLIIDHYHQINCHTGSHLLISLLRQRYWILSARNIIRQRIRLCNSCFKAAPTIVPPLMADLPASRVQEAKAFTHTGVDYAGPIPITLTRRRGIKSQKAYICLFICLTTKAVHIELTSDLTSEGFLDALKRFLSRRGPVACLYSDNGTNFIGAKGQLDELYKFLNSTEMHKGFQTECNNRRITWKTIPPRAPHFGGMWEANVKSFKTHLYRVMGAQLLSYEELLTVLTQIECLLNSRPLCLISDEPHPEILAPAHFLMSTPLQYLPACELKPNQLNLTNRKRLLDHLVQSYWKKWHLEYLHTLQIRQKWNTPEAPIKIGTVVLLHQDNTPPLRWPTGIIEDVFPGNDGIVRVALVRTQKGTLKRPVVKLSPIPTQ